MSISGRSSRWIAVAILGVVLLPAWASGVTVNCDQYNGSFHAVTFDSSVYQSSCGGFAISCLSQDGENVCGTTLGRSGKVMTYEGSQDVVLFVNDSSADYQNTGSAYSCRCRAHPTTCSYLCPSNRTTSGGTTFGGDPGIGSSSNVCGVSRGSFTLSDCSSITSPSSTDPGDPPPADQGAGECDPNTGANGRVCSSNSDCCSGVCAVAGNAPFMTNKDCIGGSCVVGVKFTSGYSGSGPAPAGGSPVATQQKVCVPSAADIPSSVAYQKPPASVQLQGKVDSALILPSGGYLKCMLAANDKHRDPSANSCQCASGYSPMVMSSATYNTITYHLHRDRSRLDALWAQVVDLMAQHPKAAEPVQQAYHFVVPSAHAFAFCPTCPLRGPFDDGQCCSPGSVTGAACSAQNGRCTCNGSGTAWTCVNPPTGGGGSGSVLVNGCSLNKSTCQITNVSCAGTCLPMYDNSVSPPACVTAKCTGGGTSTGGSSGGSNGGAVPATPTQMYSDQSPPQWKASGNPNYGVAGAVGDGANSIGSGQVIACVKTCPSGASKGSDPNSCVCDNPAQTFDPNTWSCQSCSAGAYIPSGQTECVCPPGYQDVSGTCKPDPISLPEYYADASGYPICGPGRLPMTYGYASSRAVSSLLPRISTTYTSPVTGKSYAYAVDDGSGLPKYFYANYPHCGCVGHSVNDMSSTADIAVNGTFSADLYEAVSSRGSNGKPNQQVAPLAIAHDGTSDGRLGALFSAGQSECGCPNINEEMVPASPTGIAGPHCQPKIDPNDPNLVFSKDFDPVYDAWAVMNPAEEVKGADGIVSTIRLASSSSPESAAQLYQRGIWKCQNGYTVNPDTKKCEFDLTKHQCAGDSPVSSKISGSTAADRFSNAVNKKLACCLNQYDPSDVHGRGFLKFDCVENADTPYTNFNELWTSSDAGSDGGQLNAFMLSNSMGKAVTGFYTLNGERCNEYSEFSNDPIQPGLVNPAQPLTQGRHANGSMSPDAFEPIGSALPKPTSSAFNTLVSGLGARAHPPSTPAEKRRCPVLVRAAILTACPSNPQSTAAPLRTYVEPGTKIKHCSMAESIQVHIRMEQVWEIAGMPRLQPVDTVLDNRAASAVSISQIIANKYGDACPPGSTHQGDTCVY